MFESLMDCLDERSIPLLLMISIIYCVISILLYQLCMNRVFRKAQSIECDFIAKKNLEKRSLCILLAILIAGVTLIVLSMAVLSNVDSDRGGIRLTIFLMDLTVLTDLIVRSGMELTACKHNICTCTCTDEFWPHYGLEPISMITGWLERSLIVSGFLIEDWTICALIVAAKTIVNIRSDDNSGKRYKVTSMIGTLSSIVIAMYLCIAFFR